MLMVFVTRPQRENKRLHTDGVSMYMNHLPAVPPDLPESSGWRAAGGEWPDGSSQAVGDQRLH